MAKHSMDHDIELPDPLKTAFVRLLTQFHTASDSYPDLFILIVGAKPDALDKLDGPPPHMWRDQHSVVWTKDVQMDDWTYRFHLYGEDTGVSRFTQMLNTADGLLKKLSKSAGTWPFIDSDEPLGWLGLIHSFAMYGSNPLLESERWTWDGDRLYWVDRKNQIIAIGSSEKYVPPIFDNQPDWFFCPIEPNVFSASEYVIDSLLGQDAPMQVISATAKGSSLPRSQKGKRKVKRTRRPRPLTEHQVTCWKAYETHGSFEKAAKYLGISREAVRKAARRAEAKIPSTSRSVMAKQKLPEDQRGQVYLPDDE